MGSQIPCCGLLVTHALSFKAGVDPCLCASLSVCNGFLRFTFSVTPADLWPASISAKSFDPHTCNVYLQAFLGLNPEIEYVAILILRRK